MQLSRRQLVQAIAASTAVVPLSRGALASTPPTPARFAPAIAAIRAFGEAHRRAFNLPALAISVSAPGLPAGVIPLGDQDPARHAKLQADTLVQPGSISKQMMALLAHQLVGEGKFTLEGDARAYLPGVQWPAKQFSLQQLIDHTTGLPSGAPLFPAGGLWLGFEPGSEWSYCNLGYHLLGRMIERAGGASLARLMRDRVFAPLGMLASKGAILTTDRTRFAVGYQPLRLDRPYVPGDPIAPAPWVESFDAAGSVTSSAPDMARYLAALRGALLGKGLPGLTPTQAHAFVTHSVASSRDGMRYGNGLMHVTDEHGRAYLHHTGGMVSFSSSMHVGVDDGIGAFASSTIHYGTGYRPRLLTMFAVQAMRAASAGLPVPAAPPLASKVDKPDAFVGQYKGLERSFSIRREAAGLTLVQAGVGRPLYPLSEDRFASRDPAFAEWPLEFERTEGRIVAAHWGPESFALAGSGWTASPSDPALAGMAGRYANDDAWSMPVRVVERGGKLYAIGDEGGELIKVAAGTYAIGKASSPERLSFGDPIDGRPQTLLLSGVPLFRRDL
jgi:CubicO group peptidase (beta-lactamase class C family)